MSDHDSIQLEVDGDFLIVFVDLSVIKDFADFKAATDKVNKIIDEHLPGKMVHVVYDATNANARRLTSLISSVMDALRKKKIRVDGRAQNHLITSSDLVRTTGDLLGRLAKLNVRFHENKEGFQKYLETE